MRTMDGEVLMDEYGSVKTLQSLLYKDSDFIVPVKLKRLPQEFMQTIN